MTVAVFLFLVAVAVVLPLLCGLVGWRYWRVRCLGHDGIEGGTGIDADFDGR